MNYAKGRSWKTNIARPTERNFRQSEKGIRRTNKITHEKERRNNTENKKSIAGRIAAKDGNTDRRTNQNLHHESFVMRYAMAEKCP